MEGLTPGDHYWNLADPGFLSQLPLKVFWLAPAARRACWRVYPSLRRLASCSAASTSRCLYFARPAGMALAKDLQNIHRHR